MTGAVVRKLAVALLSLAGVGAIAGSIATGRASDRDARTAATLALRDAAGRLAALEGREIEMLSSTLEALVADPRVKAAFVARDRAKLLAVAAPKLEVLKARDHITHWYFIDPEPKQAVFLRVHKPELFGDRESRATLERAIATKGVSAGRELGKTAFALRVVRPYYADGTLVGYVELGETVRDFLEHVKTRTGDDFGLLVQKKYLDEKNWAAAEGAQRSTWNDRPDVVLVNATSFGDGLVDFGGDLDAVPDDGMVLEELVKNRRDYVRGVFPLRDAMARRVGALFILHDVTGILAAVKDDRRPARLGVIGVALLAVALLLVGLAPQRNGSR